MLGGWDAGMLPTVDSLKNLNLHPRSGWAQEAPSKGARISNIDYMNFEVMVAID